MNEKNGPPDDARRESGITPEIRARALEQFNEEEILAALKEVRETGGLELRDFIQELEEAARK